MLPLIDSANPTYHKMIMLASVSLIRSSAIAIVDSLLVATNPTTFVTEAFYTTGNMTFSNGSSLVIQNCSLSTSYGNPVYMSSLLTFSSSSFFAISSSTMNAAAGGGAVYLNNSASFISTSRFVISSCVMTSGGGQALLIRVNATFTTDSCLAVISCNMTSGGGPNSAFYLNSVVYFTNSSYLVLSSSMMFGYAFAFRVDEMTVDRMSYVAVVKNTFATATNSSTAPVTLSRNAPLLVGDSSWILWKGNLMTSVGGYFTCIENGVNVATTATVTSPPPLSGAISMLDNTCNCGSGCSMWNASSVSLGGGGKIYQRCNTVNGVPVLAGSSLLPTGFISVGACGSCNATADCFVPLTIPNSTCTINITSATNAAVCQCLQGGIASNMCLPPWPPATPATRTTSVSPSSEMSSEALSASASRTDETRTTSTSYLSRTTSSSTTFSWPAVSASATASNSRTASISPSGSSIKTLTQSPSKSGGTLSLSGPTKGGRVTHSHSAFAWSATATSVTASPQRNPSSNSPTAVSSPSVSPSTFVCELSPKVVLRNTTSLSFTVGGSSLDGSSNATGVVTVAAGGTVPMALVLAATGSSIWIDFAATAGYSFGDPVNVSVSLGNIVRSASHSSSISVVISLAYVKVGELSASSETRFSVSARVIVLPPIGTLCPPRNVTLVFECFFGPLQASAELHAAVQMTYRLSTGISSALGNPVAAMSNTAMLSILTLEECVFSDIDPLDASVSPIPFAFGAEIGQYYRGGVVIGVAINILYFVLALGVAAVAPTCAPSKTATDVLGLLRYPSSVMIFVGMFHQGMSCSSVSLLRLADSTLDTVLGICGLAVATSLTIFMWLAGTRWRLCHITDRSERETRSSVRVVQHFLDLALWKQHWVDDVLDDGMPSGCKRRYLLILEDMTVSSWAAVELMSGLVQGAILGVRKNDLQACQIQRLVLAVHCFLMAVASLNVRPRGSFFGNFFLCLSKIVSFVVSLLIVIHTVSGSEEVHRGSQLATAGFTFVSSLQTAIQVLLVLVLSRDSLLALFRSVRRRPAVDGDDDGFGHVPLKAIFLEAGGTEQQATRSITKDKRFPNANGFEGGTLHSPDTSAVVKESQLMNRAINRGARGESDGLGPEDTPLHPVKRRNAEEDAQLLQEEREIGDTSQQSLDRKAARNMRRRRLLLKMLRAGYRGPDGRGGARIGRANSASRPSTTSSPNAGDPDDLESSPMNAPGTCFRPVPSAESMRIAFDDI